MLQKAMVLAQDGDDSSLEENLIPEPRMMPNSMLPILKANPEASSIENPAWRPQCKGEEVHCQQPPAGNPHNVDWQSFTDSK